MLDFSTQSSSEVISTKIYENAYETAKSTYENEKNLRKEPTKTPSTKCDEDASNTTQQTKTTLNNPELPKQHQKRHAGISNTNSFSALSLISPALLTTRSSLIQPTIFPPQHTPSLPSGISRATMNDKIVPSPLSPTKVLGMPIKSTKVLPTNSAPSSLKLLPKKFSPFSVDSLLSHKEKQAASDDSNGEYESPKKSPDFRSFSNKNQSKIKGKDNDLSSGTSTLESQDKRSQPLGQDSIGVGHHLSVAKFLLNNNLHDRNSSETGLSRIQSSNSFGEVSDSNDKYKCGNTKLSNYHNRDSSDSQKCLEKKEINDIDNENGSSNDNDIDVCGDEADIDDEDDEYHDEINDIKSEGNYQHMMSDEEASVDEDTENGEFVKTEDVEEEKLELERQLLLSHQRRSHHHLTSTSGISPKEGPLLHPRFPLGFPITSASPNPFSPPSPISTGVGGSVSLPRPTPSFPWLPQLRSPLQLPGFIASKYYLFHTCVSKMLLTSICSTIYSTTPSNAT